jgi:ring-1,2-phenylacetyl-CoA epoxidase subunit PaaE
MANYLHLKVKDIITETPDTKTIVFWQPIHKAISYQAGQFVTVLVPIAGQVYRRSYSMSSSPREADLAITVKQLAGGLVSEYLCNKLQIGDMLEVLEPSGNFVLATNSQAQCTMVLFAGGSGITPIFSILKTALPQLANAKICLVYASRNEEHIIFRKQLDALEKTYPNLKVLHVLSQPSYTWSGYRTRINQASVVTFLKQDLAIDIKNASYYLCGPTAMMQQIKQALAMFDVPNTAIHQEVFVTNETNSQLQNSPASTSATYHVQINYEGQTYNIPVKPSETILEAALNADIDLPYSCQAGMCTACMGLCTQGRIRMDEEDGLTEAEIAKGYVLTCVSHPVSDGVVIDVD